MSVALIILLEYKLNVYRTYHYKVQTRYLSCLKSKTINENQGLGPLNFFITYEEPKVELQNIKEKMLELREEANEIYKNFQVLLENKLLEPIFIDDCENPLYTRNNLLQNDTIDKIIYIHKQI